MTNRTRIELRRIMRTEVCANHEWHPLGVRAARGDVAHAIACELVEGCYACGVARYYETAADGSTPWAEFYVELAEVEGVSV